MFFFWTLFLSILCLPASQGWTIITAEPGQTVSLPCRAGRDRGITAVEWDRSDMWSEYVFLFRDNKPDPEDQHPSYQNRVDLQDRQMKDGDVSLVLKNVTTDDTGTYECRVYKTGTSGTPAIESISIIHLEVSPPGQNITVTAGDDVILPCRAPSNYKQPYDAVEWSRGGHETEHVFVFRDGKPDPAYENPSYQNRVDLQDRQMENGDVSLLLKDVTINDGGTYECRVRQRGGNRRKRDVDPISISIVYLKVSPSGLPIPWIVAATVLVIIAMAAAAAAAGVWIYKKKKNSAPPPQPDSGEKVSMSPSVDQTDQQPDV